MPLHPEMKTLIGRVAAWDATHGPQRGLDFQRRRTPALRAEVWRPEMLSVSTIIERAIPGADGSLLLRIYYPPSEPGDYRPPAPGEKRTTILYCHGGGFTGGDLRSHESHARRLCLRLGAVVVAVDFRLAPEHRYPAASEDVLTALVWVRENMAVLGGDQGRLVVAGDGTGGALAAALALEARDRGLPLAAQLLVYPVLDLAGEYPSMSEPGYWQLLGLESGTDLGADYLMDPGQALDPGVSPLLAELEGVAPAVIVVAEYDPFRDHGTAYADKLTAAGVSTSYRCENGLLHSFADMGASGAAVAASSRFCQDLADMLSVESHTSNHPQRSNTHALD